MAVNCASVHQHQGGYRFLTAVNAKVAHDSYDSFVDVSLPILEIHQFAERQNLPLNEHCMSVFHARIAPLQENDWIELDRSILELIGFENRWSELKNKEMGSDGNPVMMVDTRKDFSDAIRCLKNTLGFVEGQSFDDSHAHFLIAEHDCQQTPIDVQRGPTDALFPSFRVDGANVDRNDTRGGSNGQSVWIRMRQLDYFVLIANKCNSLMVHKFLLDLKYITSEYCMYVRVHRGKHRMNIKDSIIKKLSGLVLELSPQRV